jgi:hypothetical protein
LRLLKSAPIEIWFVSSSGRIIRLESDRFCDRWFVHRKRAEVGPRTLAVSLTQKTEQLPSEAV